ncbi:MAG TPA: hypothetical protein VK988_12415 [Acidimicrobiales bacterium]|nr:hypothetical protein [Acidimicrobiales bacterium]
MSETTITVLGARGGHGTTTVATAIAIIAAGYEPTELVSHDAAPLLGVPEPNGNGNAVPIGEQLFLSESGTRNDRVTVVDGGTIQEALSKGTGNGACYVVLRGPCFLGLRTLVANQDRGRNPAGIILVPEEGRSLRERDVEEVLGVPVVARVRHSPTVARTIDAGLFLTRLHCQGEFEQLRRLVVQMLSPRRMASRQLGSRRLAGIPGSSAANRS